MVEIWVKRKKRYIENNHLITILLNNYMFLKIDVRENDIIQNIRGIIQNKMAYQDIEIIVETLPIGDIIICDDQKNDLVIIERKTVNDLLASIKDGRYEEQSHRLSGSDFHNHNVIYLIEGDINRANRFKDNSMDKTIFYSSLFSLNYYKGFSVLRTFSIEETALFICNTAYKLRKGLEEKKVCYYKNNTNNTNNICANEIVNEKSNTEEQEQEPYVNVIKKVKKENITPENIGEIMLCQIPGISSVSAVAIMKNFSSLSNLIEEMTKNEKCLENIQYTNTKGQQRKINKTCIENIQKYLLKK
jgi:crossover junction endonuclease MUS81